MAIRPLPVLEDLPRMRLLVALLSVSCVRAIELTFWIDPQGTECFFEDVYKGDEVSGNFQVTSGGNMEVDFNVSTDQPSAELFRGLVPSILP